LTMGGYSESKIPAIDSQTLTRSLILAYPAHIDKAYVLESQDDNTNMSSGLYSLSSEEKTARSRSAATATISTMKGENERQGDLPYTPMSTITTTLEGEERGAGRIFIGKLR